MTIKNKSAETQHLEDLGMAFECSDLGNANRFASKHGKDLKYLTQEKAWAVWDGTRWSTSDGLAVAWVFAEDVVKGIYDEAKECSNNQGRAKLTSWALRSQSRQSIDAMISLASKQLSTSLNIFDSDPNDFNCKNGIVNLRTGELKAHGQDQLVMKLSDADYKPQARCPQWEQFLNQVFLGDWSLIQYVQKALGYSLTGHTTEHHLFIAYGLGSNGKTTLFETVLELLGDYGRTCEFSTFLGTDKSDVRNREAVGMLKGVRFGTASETESTKKWNEALVKKLTGGDTLIGAKLHSSSFEFKPSHKLWLQANHLPGVKDASYGFWRRIVVIPFKAKFEGSAKVLGLKERLLREEREGILNWLVEGARAYLSHGLGEMPEACRAATDEYQAESDAVGRYIKERLERCNGTDLGVQVTYDDYFSWCNSNREESTPLKFFISAMEERGLDKKRKSNGAVFLNWRFKRNYHDFGGVPVEAPFPDVTTTYEEIPAKRPLADLIAEARATAKDPADRYNPNIDYFEEWDAGVKAKGWR